MHGYLRHLANFAVAVNHCVTKRNGKEAHLKLTDAIFDCEKKLDEGRLHGPVARRGGG